MADNTPPASGSQTPASALKAGRRSLIWWGYLANYVMLGASALIILLEIIDSGVWRRLGIPLLFISMAIVNLTAMHARERKRAEQDAATGPGRT